MNPHGCSASPTSSSFEVLYAPGAVAGPTAADPPEMDRARTRVSDYRELILAPDRERFLASYPIDITPTSDDRPFFFHTTRLRDQLECGVRPIDAVWQRAERIADVDWHLRVAGCALRWRARCSSAEGARRRAGADGWSTSAHSARDSCCSKSRCCSVSCCCSATLCIR